MIEKLKIARKEEAPEVAEPPTAEQDILEKLHAENEREHDGRAPAETLGKLHQDIERCGCYPIFKQYASGEMPTLDRMFTNIKDLVAEMDRDIETERALVSEGEHPGLLQHLEKSRGLLLGRESQIRGTIQRYVNQVIRFNRLRKLQADGARDMVKQYEQTDHARRRAHNDLINSLTTYVQVIRDMRVEGAALNVYEHFNFSEWDTTNDARRVDKKTTVIFDPSVMQNREFIRDWAIVADFHEQLKELGDDEWLNKTGTTDTQ